jgi:cytoskeletal protein RodZ
MENKSKSNIILLAIVIILLGVGLVYAFFYNFRQANQKNTGLVDNFPNENNQQNISDEKRSTPTPVPPISQNYECQSVAGFNCNDYANGWKAIFKKENNLSEAEFNSYITITSVAINPLGNNYELAVRYQVKKDWLTANKVDSILLGIGSPLKPDQLPTERDSSTSGRTGVSSVEVKSPLSFSSNASAIKYFTNIYGQGLSNIKTIAGFQYFWNIEQDRASYAGQGGEPYLEINGEINITQNRCFTGQISLIGKKTVFQENPCAVN